MVRVWHENGYYAGEKDERKANLEVLFHGGLITDHYGKKLRTIPEDLDTEEWFERDVHWNDFDASELFLCNDEYLFIIHEGDGTNIDETDEERGYVDYWLTSYIDGNGNITMGGQWMETKSIAESNYTIKQLIERMYDCDLWKSNWRVISPDDANLFCLSATNGQRTYYDFRDEYGF